MDKHPFDAASFVLALLVLGLGTYFVLGGDAPSRLAPILIVGVGAAMVAGALQRGAGRDNASPKFDSSDEETDELSRVGK